MTGEKTFTFVTDTVLGKIQAAAGNNALFGLWFIGQKYFPADTKEWISDPAYPLFVLLKSWLEDYFSAKNPERKKLAEKQKPPKMNIPLSPRGTPFQQAVWNQLLKIPYGKTCTYGAIAAKLASSGKKASAQAVGGAVGHNPISILIPCHRVIGADGNLTGYAGGLDKKRALLELESR